MSALSATATPAEPVSVLTRPVASPATTADVRALPLVPPSALPALRGETIFGALCLLFVMATGSFLTPGTGPTGLRLLGALALAVFALALLYVVDGFAVGAYRSTRELARALAGAGAVGAAVALALAWRWPAVFSPAFAAELAVAIAGFGHVVASPAGGSARTRRRAARTRALVLVAGGESALGDDFDRLARRVEVVGRISLPPRAARLEAALAFYRPELVLVEESLADLDFEFVHVCWQKAVRVLVLQRAAYGPAVGRPIVRLGGLPWLPLRPLALAPRHRRAKRALDLLLLLAAAPLVLPIAGVAALVVGTTSRGGVIYRQIRLGEGGKPFAVLKFRTMRADAEVATGPVLSGVDDPRVTSAGRVLRRLRLDELPQLWNVLRGEMTLVGPRPERPEFAAEFSAIPGYDRRHLIRPGLTGLAQLVGGYSASASDKLRCDLLYLSSRSVRLDLRLIAATAFDLVRGFPGG